MCTKKHLFLLSVFIAVIALSFAHAETMPWVMETFLGGGSGAAYYARTTTKISIEREDFEYEYDFIRYKAGLRLDLRPVFGNEYGIKLGIMGGRLERESAVKDVYRDDMRGLTAGFAYKLNLSGEGDIIPAIDVAAGVHYEYAPFSFCQFSEYDKDTDMSYKRIVDDYKANIQLFGLEGTILASKRIAFIFPYLGVKFFNNWVRWKEVKPLNTLATGGANGISPFIGLRIPEYTAISAQGQINFLDEYGWSAGLRYSVAF